MATYEVDYSKHATLTPGVEDFITVSRMEHINVYVTNVGIHNHHETVPLWFDYSYPDGSEPQEVWAKKDNTFIVPPKRYMVFQPHFSTPKFRLYAEAEVPYSIQIF